MGTVWVPGAERVPGAQGGGTMVGGNPRSTQHITADKLTPDGFRPKFEAVRDHLVRARFEPHLMVDPFTGRIAQFLPANRSAYALQNAKGGVETNRQGTVNIQVEWFFSPGTRYGGRTYQTLDETPLLGMDQVLALCDSWGIPRVWPAGPPSWATNSRDPKVWLRAGYFAHSQTPENNHRDPGPLTLRSPSAPPRPVQEDDDMAVTPQDGETLAPYIAREALGVLGLVLGPNGQLGQALAQLQAQQAKILAELAAIKAGGGQGGVDPAAVADRLTVTVKES